MNSTSRPAIAARGFTLVEILVTLSVIAVLIAILIPTLSGARLAVGQTKSLANLRSLGVTIEHYASAKRSQYPYYEAGATMHLVTPELDTTQGAAMSPHWHIDKMWPVLMHDIAPWDEHLLTWYSPGREHAGPPNTIPLIVGFGAGPVSYHYSNSFIASPRVWNGRGDATEDDIGPVNVAAVAHTSAKVVMFDYDRAYIRRSITASDPRPLLFADGSAAARLDTDAADPVPNVLNAPEYPRRYHDTPDGVLGRDF